MLVLTGDAIVPMRWGIIPVGRKNARGRPVMETIVNARSETLFDKSAFAGTGRALLLADGWYEWTGKRGRKTPWRIRPRDGSLLPFAAITDTWIAPDNREVHQVAPLTCAPNGDVAPYHDRMGVLLATGHWQVWLDAPPEQVRELFRPAPDGSMHIEPADDVDWTAP
ncbi:SOS response associated peptidase (SRAP) [Aliiruegeria haliotis]|uniref:Abasic site processing protein n=1 Tax=Aliiruegeria haliotis TaxID=1280846 RepID=A0A2T0RGG9_9RHOB|nr:SOS response associated peptidase (SRAP) [Aliiruegeria haliotis]